MASSTENCQVLCLVSSREKERGERTLRRSVIVFLTLPKRHPRKNSKNLPAERRHEEKVESHSTERY